MASSAKNSPNKALRSLFVGLGIGLVLFAGFVLFRLFRDPVKQEFHYVVTTRLPRATLLPPDTDFSLVIDKIGASSRIIKNVDSLDSRLYQLALRDGIAQAKGSSLPGEGSNIFLFAHSSADLMTAERYNSVFYLLHHLESGDLIKVFYLGKQYDYAVTDKRIVAPTDTSYLRPSSSEQLTLMTCWPPGTTLKRLIILAKPL